MVCVTEILTCFSPEGSLSSSHRYLCVHACIVHVWCEVMYDSMDVRDVKMCQIFVV
jgi:hypothetical protein